MASQLVQLPLPLLQRIAQQRHLGRYLGLKGMGAEIEEDASLPFTVRIIADPQFHCPEAWPVLLEDAFVVLLSSVDATATRFRPVPLSEATAAGLLDVVREALLELEGLSAHEKMQIARAFRRAVTSDASLPGTERKQAINPPSSILRRAMKIQASFTTTLCSLDSKLARYQAIVSRRGLDYLVSRLACHAELGQFLHIRPHVIYQGRSELYLLAESGRGSFMHQRYACENLANTFEDAVRHMGPYSARHRPPVDLAYIKQLHLEIMRGVDGRDRSGEWRTGTMWVHSPVSGDISKGQVPADGIQATMERFEKDFLSEEWEPVHPLVHAGLAHLELVRVHPFRDGNGRLARMLLQILLLRRGLPLLPWELTFVRDRPAYLAAVDEAISKEDPAPFLQFLLGACANSAALGYRMAQSLRRERTAVTAALVDLDVFRGTPKVWQNGYLSTRLPREVLHPATQVRSSSRTSTSPTSIRRSVTAAGASPQQLRADCCQGQGLAGRRSRKRRDDRAAPVSSEGGACFGALLIRPFAAKTALRRR
jgi:fido (protein-threonine AMPylation protein)